MQSPALSDRFSRKKLEEENRELRRIISELRVNIGQIKQRLENAHPEFRKEPATMHCSKKRLSRAGTRRPRD
jgi:predicted RNase H-like nuclease (RuvC/YqgF family)